MIVYDFQLLYRFVLLIHFFINISNRFPFQAIFRHIFILLMAAFYYFKCKIKSLNRKFEFLRVRLIDLYYFRMIFHYFKLEMGVSQIFLMLKVFKLKIF